MRARSRLAGESGKRVIWGLASMVMLACGDEAPPAEAPVEPQADAVQPMGSREAFAVPPDGGPAIWFLGSLAQVKATVEESGGQWGAIVVTGAPGYAPVRHIHRREDESFYVLEGELQFTAGDQTFQAGPGTFVYAPMGVPHGFVVVSEVRAKWLLIHGPTGDFHRFIQEVGGPAGDPIWPTEMVPPDPADVREIALKHHIEPVPPTDTAGGR